MDTSESIGQWIVKARSHKQWTQTQLGDAIGVTKANVSHWETGKHEPSFGQLLRIKNVTGFGLREVGQPPGWPFPRVPVELIVSLRPDQLEALQAGILGILTAIGQARPPSSKRGAAN